MSVGKTVGGKRIREMELVVPTKYAALKKSQPTSNIPHSKLKKTKNN